MEAVFYTLACGGSALAPVQLARSLESLRLFDADLPVFVFLFGEPPAGLLEALAGFNAEVRQLGDYRAYLARTEPERAELFALDLKLHRWLVLQEPELKACARFLYIDSDTLFFQSPRALFDRYRQADLYAREEPCSRRSVHGYDPILVDEEVLAELRAREGRGVVAPFNTGVCLLTRKMADTVTAILPDYFDYLFRFLAGFNRHPLPGPQTMSPAAKLVHDRFLRDAWDRALPYPGKNRWIADQFALWLALGKFADLSYGDFTPADVWQGAEFQWMATRKFPILCHYFGGQGHNTKLFFDSLLRLPRRSTSGS